MQSRIRVWLQAFKGRRFMMLQWIDPITGARKTRSAKTDDPKVAERARSDLEYELNHGLHQATESIPWATLVDAYDEDVLAFRTPHYRANVLCSFKRFEAAVRPRLVDRIDERALAKYARELRLAQLATATIRAYLTFLRGALRWAAAHHIIDRAPAIALPKLPRGRLRAKIRAAGRITVEEFERLLAKAPNDDWRLLISLAWHCGLRRMEARGVSGADVDLPGHWLAVPKNKAGDEAARAIIPPELDDLLRARFGDRLPAGPLVGRGCPRSGGRISKGFAAIARAANVMGNGKNGSCTLHDLRRNYGTRWAGRVHSQVLMAMMRHQSLSTTLEFYADVETAAQAAVWPGRGDD